MDREHFLSTKDLVTIALLSALGGGLSTYVGYLGNLINRAVGVPFGAGQFMAGLHVMWMVLAVGITRKKGVGTVTGLLKGTVELFMGSTHGVIIVVISLIQGILVDIFLFNDETKKDRELVPYSIAGGASAASNVLVFQAFFFSGVPFLFIFLLCMLAFASGAIFGGYITLQLMDSLQHGGLIHGPEPKEKPAYMKYASVAVSIIFLISFTLGGVFYFTNVYTPPGQDEIHITGNVNNEYDFVYDDFEEYETVVSAELTGSVTHVPEKNYTGIPLHRMIEHSDPSPDSERMIVSASDGYSATFNYTRMMDNDRVIITYNEGKYRLIAGGYDGSKWVKDVNEIRIE